MKWGSKETEAKFNGFLDRGASFTGELKFEGTFRIDGEFHGSIRTVDVLIVGPRAAVHADIRAGEVKVHGTVFGNIEAIRRVEVGSTGRVRGDIRTAQLIVEAGATFEGRSRSNADPPTSEPTAEETVIEPANHGEKSPAPQERQITERLAEPERPKRRWPDGFPP